MGDQKIKEDQGRLLVKIEHYCAYQERCGYDVAMKLRSWRVEPEKIPLILKRLYDEHFIDDERFARAFVRGKFHINRWGHLKIIHELKARQLDERIIQNAMNEIGPEEYRETLEELIKKKYSQFSGTNNLAIREKIINFVTGKGFEFSLAESVLNDLNIIHDNT